ncbi:MAG: SIS domain-containing protein [Candidatus Zixiibacteriota bacterium]
MNRVDDDNQVNHGREVILQEAEAVRALAERLDERFARAVKLITACRGRVILTGIGKSGHIARKLAATFTSTGAPAFFLHPAEGAHGDLGLLQKGDLLIALSKSGSTVELEMVFPSVTKLGLKSILLTGQIQSALAERVDVALDCTVAAEACPHNLAPTTSATAAMVMGHALAIAALRVRNFTSEQFADLHPAGSLGQRLLLRVRDRMHTGEAIPIVEPERLVRDTLFEITGKRLGCALVCDNERRLLGIFTDGDLRRLTVSGDGFLNLPTRAGMTATPQRIDPEALLDEALALMEKRSITALPVTDESHAVVGILHLHDILGPEKPALSPEVVSSGRADAVE